jgi:hypothetical protein
VGGIHATRIEIHLTWIGILATRIEILVPRVSSIAEALEWR